MKLFRLHPIVWLWILVFEVFTCSGTDLYFVNRKEFKFILPKVINVNRLMRLYALCIEDDCKLSFLFQCLKFVNDDQTKRLVNVFDLAVFKRNLIQNQLITFDLPNFEPNLERCYRSDLSQSMNRIELEIHIQFYNNLNLINQNPIKQRFAIELSSYANVKIILNQSVYRNGQWIKFLILPFNLNFETFNQPIIINLLTPTKQCAKRWPLNYFARDQFDQFEYKLSNLPINGLWTIEALVLNQVFRKSFPVINYEKKRVSVIINFKNYVLVDERSMRGSIEIVNTPDLLDNYFLICSIILVFKDTLSRQEINVELNKFTIHELTAENIIKLDLNYLFDQSIDRSRLSEYLEPKYDLNRQAFIRIQADLFCRAENTNCMLDDLSGQRTVRNVRIIQKTKYIYCPKQMQSNHSLSTFKIQIRCWLTRLSDYKLTTSLNDDQKTSQEIIEETSEDMQSIEQSTVEEVIMIKSWVRTYSNYRIPFKTIQLRSQNSGLIRFSLSLLEKLAKEDLKNILSIELELKLDNDFIERLNIHFHHSNSIRNLLIDHGNNRNIDQNQIKLMISRYEARVNETVILSIESSSVYIRVVLVQISTGQLLDVSLMDTKTKMIRITEDMFPNLELKAYAHFDGKLIESNTSLKIQKRALPPNRMLTSFNRIANSSTLSIKLWSDSRTFAHIRSLKKDLSILEQNLDRSTSETQTDKFTQFYTCFFVQELVDNCINHFKLNEYENRPTNRTGLSFAVDNLFFNHTNKKPFFFEILSYNESHVHYIEFLQSRTMVNSDFEQNLVHTKTEHFNSRNSTLSNYERTYTFAIEEETKDEVYYLDLIKLSSASYQVNILSLQNLGKTELIKLHAKIQMNNRLYVNEWTNGQLEIQIDRSLVGEQNRIRVLFENSGDYKISMSSGELLKWSHKNGNLTMEFEKKARLKDTLRFQFMPLRTGNIRIYMRVSVSEEATTEPIKTVLVMQPGYRYSFFMSRNFELIQNLGKSLFFTIDPNQLIDPLMQKNLLSSVGRITMTNDILNELSDEKSAFFESEQANEISQTGAFQLAVNLAIKFVRLQSQKELELQNLKINLEDVEMAASRLLAFYDSEYGYFSQLPGQPGNLYITAFVVDLMLQIKSYQLTSEICQFRNEQIIRSLRWITKKSTSLFGNLFDLNASDRQSNKLEHNSGMNESIEIQSKFVTSAQVLIAVCNAKANAQQSDSDLANLNLNQTLNLNISKKFRLNKNMIALLNQTIFNNTKLLSLVDISKSTNEFSSLLAYSLFKYRIYTQQPFYRDASKNDFSNHFNNYKNTNHSNHYSIRPRTFDSGDTLAILNTAVLLILKLEQKDYDDSLDKFYTFVNSHKLRSNEQTSGSTLSTYYSLLATLKLRQYHYRNINNLRRLMNRTHKPIYYKQIVANNLTRLDLKDTDNLNRIMTVSVRFMDDQYGSIRGNAIENDSIEFDFEFKKPKTIKMLITDHQLNRYRQLYFNFNGVGYFKMDLEIECYFRYLAIDSIPHVKSYNHRIELQPLRTNLYNLTLCQSYTFDKTYSPLTIIEFNLPIQLTLKPNQQLRHSNRKIDYLSLGHLLHIQLFNLNKTVNCFSIILINDMPFYTQEYGHFYSKIYDYRDEERFNLTTGKIFFQNQNQFISDSSSTALFKNHLFIFCTLIGLLFQLFC